jgi:putative peptide zinc metalloprotease protein
VRTSQLELARRLTGDRSAISVKSDELATLISERTGYDARLARLELGAAAAGRIAELAPGIAAGVWVNSHTRLARIISARPPRLIAYVSEAELHRVRPGTAGTAWLDGQPDTDISVRVVAVAPAATAALDEPLIATLHGGSIDARPARDGSLMPELALYRVDLELTAAPPALPDRVVRAQVRLVTPAISLGSRLWTKIVGLWRREFG